MEERDPLAELRWNADGLLPAIAQDWTSGAVLMMAWMNEEALRCTLKEGRAVYFSRSRQTLWRKGERSGNVQVLHELRLDCDSDCILLRVEQRGGVACHTGRANCFYRRFEDGRWQVTDAVVSDPKELYGSE